MPASWSPRRADGKSRILRRPIGGLRRGLGAALLHPFNEQHIADGQDHGPHKQAKKTVGVIEQVQDHLPAAIGHVIDEDAVRPTQICRPQDEEVRFVLHHPMRVSRRLVEIGNDAVFRGRRIDLALRDALDFAGRSQLR